MQSQVPEPFTYLQDLEQTLRARAPGLPGKNVSSEEWIAVVFLTGTHVFLTALEEVEEILPVHVLTPVPGVKSWIRGMATLRGEIFPVTDLMGYVEGGLSKIRPASRIIVVRFQEEFAGLLVDKVLGLQRMPDKTKAMPKGESIKGFESYIKACFVNEQLELPIVSLQSIVEHPHFRDVTAKGSQG